MHVLRRPVELAVVSGPLEKTYLELVPTSEFGGNYGRSPGGRL